MDVHETRPYKKQHVSREDADDGTVTAAPVVPTARELFPNAAKFDTFVEIQRSTRYQINALLFSLPAAVVQARQTEVAARGLDDDSVMRALRARREAVEAHITGNDLRIQESMLQLFRVMSRRKIAVIDGSLRSLSVVPA